MNISQSSSAVATAVCLTQRRIIEAGGENPHQRAVDLQKQFRKHNVLIVQDVVEPDGDRFTVESSNLKLLGTVTTEILGKDDRVLPEPQAPKPVFQMTGSFAD